MSKETSTFSYNFKETVAIYRRELKSYVASPILYIIMTFFLLCTGIFFFKDFYAAGRADMRFFFTLLPFLFMVFIPAITMKQFSEERSNGTLEMLLTMPVTTLDVVVGKFLASFVVVILMTAPTLLYVVSLGVAGSPDYGMIIGGYVGTLFLVASYIAIGLFASSLTHNQIIAWLLSFAMCTFLSTVDIIVQYMPGKIFTILNYISASYHFKSIAKGVLDFRDIVYFITVTLFFLMLSGEQIEERR